MWRVAAARATGSSHQKNNLNCQDRIAWSRINDTLIAVLADGAGSAQLSEQGAELAVNSVLHYCRNALGEGRIDYISIVRESAEYSRERIFDGARVQGVDPKQFASTLLVALVGKNGGAALQIGDGVIVVRRGSDRWCYQFWPQRGEFFNVTQFLTADDAFEVMQIDEMPGVDELVLMSDGLEPLALEYATESVFDPFFDGLFKPLLNSTDAVELAVLSVELEKFLQSSRVSDRTNDDVSLILATRRVEPLIV